MPVDDMSFLLGQAEFPFEDPPSRIFLLPAGCNKVLLSLWVSLSDRKYPLKVAILSFQTKASSHGARYTSQISLPVFLIAVNGHKDWHLHCVKALIKAPFLYIFSHIFPSTSFKAAVLI